MKYYCKMIIVSILIIFGFNMMMNAQDVRDSTAGASDTWKILGTTSAKLTADHNAIVVVAPYDYFRQIKFRVTSSPLTMQRIIVRYDDGGAFDNVDTRFTVPQGSDSRVIEIDLKSGKRKLKSVAFWYDPKSILHGRAVVTLLGIK